MLFVSCFVHLCTSSVCPLVLSLSVHKGWLIQASAYQISLPTASFLRFFKPIVTRSILFLSTLYVVSLCLWQHGNKWKLIDIFESAVTSKTSCCNSFDWLPTNQEQSALSQTTTRFGPSILPNACLNCLYSFLTVLFLCTLVII